MPARWRRRGQRLFDEQHRAAAAASTVSPLEAERAALDAAARRLLRLRRRPTSCPSSTRCWRRTASFSRRTRTRSCRLEGHADERGSREYNIGLGERRAQAVRRVLMLQGAARHAAHAP